MKNRQVLWGWVLEERNVDEHGGPYGEGIEVVMSAPVSQIHLHSITGWASIQSLPRTIELDEDGVRLKFNPVPELQVTGLKRIRLCLLYPNFMCRISA
jgi:hypothetical protein